MARPDETVVLPNRDDERPNRATRTVALPPIGAPLRRADETIWLVTGGHGAPDRASETIAIPGLAAQATDVRAGHGRTGGATGAANHAATTTHAAATADPRVRGADRTVVLPRQAPAVDATDPWGHRIAASAQQAPPAPNPWHAVAAAAVPAAVMAVLGVLGLTGPALWTDELATWGMTSIPWSHMWPVLRYVDAVLAPYYVLMHAWTQLAGNSDLALRVPSVAAMVAAAALIGALGRRLAGPRAGLLAGLVFAILPSSTRFAQEARPYALAAFAAVAATYLLVRAWDRPSFWRLAGYAGAVILLGMMNVVALLLLVAHGWATLVWHRRTAVRWALAAAYGVAPLLPLLWLGHQQSAQVSYIPKVALQSGFDYASVVLGTTVLALVILVLAMFSLPLRYPAGLYTAWVVLPAVALVVVSLVFRLFLPRYLIFTLPGWALLAGAALARTRAIAAGVALVAVAALGLPTQLAIRGPAGHDEATRTVAQIITADYRPGDAAVYAATEPRGGWTTRDLVAHYVPTDRRPADPLMTRPPRTDGQLLAGECADVARCLGDPPRIWVIRLGAYADPLTGLGAAKIQVLRQHYRIVEIWRPRNLTLALLVRVAA